MSVIAVLLYHGGFGWASGGFFGVEVFFVISGFLITSLLLEESERDRAGWIDLRGFWMRRVRRLFPAMYAVLVAVAVWALFAGSVEQRDDLRRNLPWNGLYAGNWAQIVGDVPYVSTGSPPLLRHLWSLAVEEQWYVVWPLLFVGLCTIVRSNRLRGGAVFGLAVLVIGFTFWLNVRSSSPLRVPTGPAVAFDGVDRANFNYLSTLTRSSGLLLGAAAAFLWRPWRLEQVDDEVHGARLLRFGHLMDPISGAALVAIGVAFVGVDLSSRAVTLWLLPLVSVLSLAVVLGAVHPGALHVRRFLSHRWLVVIGQRSYGLYLWSWPIAVVAEATNGSIPRFVWATAVAVVVTEVSYRFIEMPVRRGVVRRWWSANRPVLIGVMAACALTVAGLGLAFSQVKRFDPLAGNQVVTFDVPNVLAASRSEPSVAATTSSTIVTATTTAGAGAGSVASEPVATGPAPPTTSPPTTLPLPDSVRLTIVGDSVARSLAINAPRGLDTVFPRLVNGGLDGCGVYDAGTVRSEVGFNNEFELCDGWQQRWANAATGSDVALVVLGAWDVFDVVVGDVVYEFDTPAGDLHFVENVRTGIDALLETGVAVGVLEVACMRPVAARGAGVPALPERGDDVRVAHVNDLLRAVADTYGDEVQFVPGPTGWCTDEELAQDIDVRWDGVHVYQRGANLIFENITVDLLRLGATVSADRSQDE